MAATDPGFVVALEQARIGRDEGGMPIGGAVVARDGRILGRGRNRLVQNKSGVTHAETNAIDSCHFLPASDWENSTVYTTLSPCDMCTGAIILYGVKRVVVGHSPDPGNTTGELYLKQRGVEVVWLKDEECEKLIREFVEGRPEVWKNEPWADGRGPSKAM